MAAKKTSLVASDKGTCAGTEDSNLLLDLFDIVFTRLEIDLKKRDLVFPCNNSLACDRTRVHV